MVKISGLAMRFSSHDTGKLSVIAGPAIYCALGFALTGGNVQLLTCLSKDVRSDELEPLAAMGVDFSAIGRSTAPSLILDIAAMRERKATFHIGNPLSWAGPDSVVFDPADIAVAANGDPHWLMTTLRRQRPGFLALDLHVAWMRSRQTALRYCIEAADLVSGTGEEFQALAKSGIQLPAGCVQLIKHGPRGVVLTDSVSSRVLPPPVLDSPFESDVGAGDFLLGLLVGTALRSGLVQRAGIDGLAAAYSACVAHLRLLLGSQDPAAFYRALATAAR